MPTMLTLPSSRLCLILAVVLLVIVLLIRTPSPTTSAVTQAILQRTLETHIQYGIDIPHGSTQHYLLSGHMNGTTQPFQVPLEFDHHTVTDATEPSDFHRLSRLFVCPYEANPHTKHIRLPVLIHNISSLTPDSKRKFNPTILALPPGMPHKYILVSRIVTTGLHQESHICLADVCHHPNTTSPPSTFLDSIPCPELLHSRLAGLNSSLLYCANAPETINIPPTPAFHCTGAWSSFPSIPGFHDPRIFWTGSGEALILVNSASQYGCLGLWTVDLRTIYQPLKEMLDNRGVLGRRRSRPTFYSTLTEITRNPPSDRNSVEKNWFFFFDGDESFVHYDIIATQTPFNRHREQGHHGLIQSLPAHEKRKNAEDFRVSDSGRSFAKLLGHGLTTPNLAPSNEGSCLPLNETDNRGRNGHWHQSSNALQLILCTRAEGRTLPQLCSTANPNRGIVVNFALVHRKFSNEMELPLRYERWLLVWGASRPYQMLARSKVPIMFWNETAGGWNEEENWIKESQYWNRAENNNGNDNEVTWNASEEPSSHNVFAEDGEGGAPFQSNWKPSTTSNSPVPSEDAIFDNSFFSRESLDALAIDEAHDTLPLNGTNHASFQRREIIDRNKKPRINPEWSSNLNKSWAYFTYTPSLAWAWRPRLAFEWAVASTRSSRPRHGHNHDNAHSAAAEGSEEGDEEEESILRAMHIGFLDDDLIVSVGLEDTAQAWARVKAQELLGCLVACPGIDLKKDRRLRP